MDPVGYVTSAQFWFFSFASLLLTFYFGYLATGPKEGRMRYQINFANSGNRVKLVSAFIVFEVVFNLAFLFSGSLL